MPISEHLSDRFDLPPVAESPPSKIESISHRKSSRDKFAKMDTIVASSDNTNTDGTIENIVMQESTGSSTPSKGRTGARPLPTRRNKIARDQKSNLAKLNTNSNGHCYYEPKPFSPPTSVQEPYLQ